MNEIAPLVSVGIDDWTASIESENVQIKLHLFSVKEFNLFVLLLDKKIYSFNSNTREQRWFFLLAYTAAVWY